MSWKWLEMTFPRNKISTFPGEDQVLPDPLDLPAFGAIFLLSLHDETSIATPLSSLSSSDTSPLFEHQANKQNKK